MYEGHIKGVGALACAFRCKYYISRIKMKFRKFRIECYSRISVNDNRQFIGTYYRNRADKRFSEDASGPRLQGTIPDPPYKFARGGHTRKTSHGPVRIHLRKTVHLPRETLKPTFWKVHVAMGKHQKIRCGILNRGGKSDCGAFLIPQDC